MPQRLPLGPHQSWALRGGEKLFRCRPQGKAFQGKGTACMKVLRCDSLDPPGEAWASSGAWSASRAWELGTEMAEPQSQVGAAWTLPEGSRESGGGVLNGRATQSVLTFPMLVMWQICWWGNGSRQMRPWRPRKEPSSPGSQSRQVICASDSRAWPSARAWHHEPGQLSSARQAFRGTVSAPNSLWKQRPAHLPVGNRKGISHNVAP